MTHHPADTTLVTATVQCFQTPTPQALDAVQRLLSAESDELMRQCVVVWHTANTVLEEEGRQLAAILAGQGQPVVCGAGCVGCCQQLVLCQPFEARGIQAYLETQPEAMALCRAAYPRWNTATASLRQSYLVWAESRYGRGEDNGHHTLDDFHEACPFLDAGGLCVIYPVRPYGCRTCIAVDPACAGKEQAGKFQRQFSLYTPHHEARMALTRLLLDRLGADASPVPMPESVARLCGW